MDLQSSEELADLMGNHQLAADVSLPSRADLLRQFLPKSQLVAIYEIIGQRELRRIASVPHGKELNPDWEAISRKEKQDLDVLYGAIRTVTGKHRPWIVGFASDFACGLLTCIACD